MYNLHIKNELLYASVTLRQGNKSVKIDKIDPYERVNGLIGLDFLRAAGVIIDLEELLLYKKH